MKMETKCLHSGYEPKNGEPRALPIYQSTTFKYDKTEDIGALFDLSASGYFYSRIGNPTVDAVEKKIADMEGGVGALCTTSGQAANLLAILNICSAGDSIVTVSEIYGGTINLFAVTLKRLGIECHFVRNDAAEEEIQAAIQPNTRLIFGETLANPAMCVFDIEKFARVAHKNGLPLIVDNTFATPVLCRPIEFGADIVTHSTTKYMDGHALQVGGVIVDSGKFPWDNGKFPELTEPDESYHGVRYLGDFGAAAYITKARVQLMRDFGMYPGAINAFLLNMGLETLAVRMDRYCANAKKVAEHLLGSEMVESVSYPSLPGDKYYPLAQKYLPQGCSGVLSMVIKGGKEAAIRFMDHLKLASNEVHVADIRTCVLHPASETHRQLNDEQLIAAGIHPGMVRLSVGLENVEDIIADVDQALEAAKG
ncbi:MAG: O-acetylhomoserine aminocarboxypropyltransferase/cysteine synthase [Oscillospiraceae bacterium]|jgi:O-acetylhomoserine (thiol)-lyase|nr:O-acetylhomoserine aminocarboxypropyltransferase/cysteine synthase [Oscillospiraceae bacterium]